jgi:hypothetical protein
MDDLIDEWLIHTGASIFSSAGRSSLEGLPIGRAEEFPRFSIPDQG